MKRTEKNNDNQIVTRGILREEFAAFDKHLEKAFDNQFNRIKSYLDFRLKPLEEMMEDYYKWKDHVNKTLDWLVGAYQKFEEKYDFVSSKQVDTQNRLENHEGRIMTLEVDKLRKNKTN